MKIPKLKQIPLNRIYNCEHPDIQLEKFYLVKVDGNYYAGKFTREWYGLVFDDYQLDGDGWEGIWEIVS
jgi:hypothetical protein